MDGMAINHIVSIDHGSYDWLVVWNIFYVLDILGIIIPTDELHHFSEG